MVLLLYNLGSSEEPWKANQIEIVVYRLKTDWCCTRFLKGPYSQISIDHIELFKNLSRRLLWTKILSEFLLKIKILKLIITYFNNFITKQSKELFVKYKFWLTHSVSRYDFNVLYSNKCFIFLSRGGTLGTSWHTSCTVQNVFKKVFFMKKFINVIVNFIKSNMDKSI